MYYGHSNRFDSKDLFRFTCEGRIFFLCEKKIEAIGGLRWPGEREAQVGKTVAGEQFCRLFSLAMAKTTISLLLISAVPVLGFVLPGGWIANKMLSARDPGRALRSTLVPRVSSLVRLKMMSQDDEWFNPNAIQRLARSVPLNPKPGSIPEMPEPILLEGALDWGYYTGMSWEGRGKGTQVILHVTHQQSTRLSNVLNNQLLQGPLRLERLAS